jgi:hypothetical protein
MGSVPTGRDVAGYDGRAARPYHLEYVPIIIGKWYYMLKLVSAPHGGTAFWNKLNAWASSFNFPARP